MPKKKAKAQGGQVNLVNRVKLTNGIRVTLLNQALQLQ